MIAKDWVGCGKRVETFGYHMNKIWGSNEKHVDSSW